MAYSNEAIEALATLRLVAKNNQAEIKVVEAINALDDAGVFRALDEQTDYAPAEEILAQWADVEAGEQHLRDTEQDQHGNSTVPDGGWDEYTRSMEAK